MEDDLENKGALDNFHNSHRAFEDDFSNFMNKVGVVAIQSKDRRSRCCFSPVYPSCPGRALPLTRSRIPHSRPKSQFAFSSLQAIDALKDSCILYCNRSLTYLKLGLPEKALKDAEMSLKANDKSLRGFVYKAQALWQMGKENESIATIEEACEVVPDKKDYLRGGYSDGRYLSIRRKTPLLPSPSKSPDADDYDNIDIVKQEDGIDEIREELRKVLKPDGTFLGEMAKIIAQECKNTDHPIEVAVRSDDTSFAVKVPDLALASQVVNRRMPSYTLKKVSAQTLEDNLNLLEKSQFSTKIECIQNELHKKPKPLAFVQENLAAFRILQSLRVHPGGENVQKSKPKTLKTRMPQKKVEKRKREICPKNSAEISGTQEEDEELVDDPKPAKKLCVSLPSPSLPSPCLSSKNIDASKRPQNPKSYSRKNQNEPSTLESRTIKLKKVCNLKFFPRKKIDIRIPDFEGNEMLHPNMKTYQRSSKKKTPVPSQVNQSRNWLCVEESFSISYEPDPLVGLRSSVKKYGRPQENGFMANLDDLIDTNSAISFTSELIINEWKEYCTMRDSTGPPPPCTADSTIGLDLILETTIFHGYYGELFPWEAKGNRLQIKKEFDIEIKQEFPDRAKSPKTPVSSSGKHNLPLPIKLVNQVARDVVLVQNRDSVLMAFPSGNDTFHIQFNGETKVLQLDDVIYNDDRTNYSNDQIVFVVEKIVHDNPDEMNAAIEATKMRLSKRSAKRSATDSSEAAHPANLNESAGSSRKKTPRLAPGSSSALNDGAGRMAGAIQDSSGESASKDTSKSRPTPGALNSSKNSGSPETKKKRKKKSCKRSLLTFDDLKTEITAEPPMPSTSKIDDPIVGKNLQNARTKITGVGDSPKTRKNSGKKSSKSSKNTRENPPSESDDDSTRFLYIAGDAEKIKKKKIGRPPLRKRNKNGTFHRETPSSDEDNMFLYIGEDAEKAKQQKATKKGKAKAPEGEKKPVQAEQRIMYNSVGFDPYRKVSL
ncbi:unnamed protein product [Nesidiocoris tenuis]|uniref:Uncharacterized protein n=1 Tax=Nesidiocoris tenuis TaxID=355587 RepID=A0A6H5GRX0_9HEMI|nr:unnamed protein product [Nesidiocoris tenuis]